jgi:hypothetical protein
MFLFSANLVFVRNQVNQSSKAFPLSFTVDEYVLTSGYPWPSDTGYPWPSDIVKSPGFFKPRERQKGAKQFF